MPEIDFEQFVSELDTAMHAHLEWSRRVLRCAVLHSSPGDDVLSNEAHILCRFGLWFMQHRDIFEEMDAERTRNLESEHQSMHDAIRTICTCIMNGKPRDVADLDTFEATQTRLINHLAFFKTIAITWDTQRDALTGLSLRHRLEQDFDLLGKHTKRHGAVLVVMLVDADHFKAVNDQNGHAAGDIVLQHLAAALRKTLRENDMAYRYGGDEFLLLMEIASAEGMTVAAQRVIEAVRALSIVLPNSAIVRPAVTIGVALATKDESLASVIQRADAALYAGKAVGRNRHVVADRA